MCLWFICTWLWSVFHLHHGYHRLRTMRPQPFSFSFIYEWNSSLVSLYFPCFTIFLGFCGHVLFFFVEDSSGCPLPLRHMLITINFQFALVLIKLLLGDWTGTHVHLSAFNYACGWDVVLRIIFNSMRMRMNWRMAFVCDVKHKLSLMLFQINT